jgi:hypothetical protein
VQVLSSRFRNVFLNYLRKAFEAGKLQFHGEMAALNSPQAFESLCRRAAKMKWVVFAKAPFGGPEQVLKYLARYTHRVAISNSRILSIEDSKVTFLWKDYADGDKTKVMTLAATEFIRRFLLHILPAGFVRIRQYGFLANRARKAEARAVQNPAQRAARGDERSRTAGTRPKARARPKAGGEMLPSLRNRPHGSHLGLPNRTARFIMKLRPPDCPRTTFSEAGAELRPISPSRLRGATLPASRPGFPADFYSRCSSVRRSSKRCDSATDREKNIQNP